MNSPKELGRRWFAKQQHTRSASFLCLLQGCDGHYYEVMTMYGEAKGELVTSNEIMDVSERVFGQTNYGQLAINIVNGLRDEAFIDATFYAHTLRDEPPYGFVSQPNIIASGLGHNKWPDYGIYEKIFQGDAAKSVTPDDIEHALAELMDERTLYFDYVFSRNSGNISNFQSDAKQLAFMVPISLTKEALGRYMTSSRDGMAPEYQPEGFAPARLSDHQLHGIQGRALDILLYISGVRDAIDPDATAVEGELIDYEEFKRGYLKYFVTPSARRNFHLNITNAVRSQGKRGQPYYPFEVIVEGDSFGANIDKLALSSLREYGRHVQKKTVGEVIARLPS